MYFVGLPLAGWVARSTLTGKFPSEYRIGEVKGCLYMYMGEDEQVDPASLNELFPHATMANPGCKVNFTQPGVLHDDAITDGEVDSIRTWLASVN